MSDPAIRAVGIDLGSTTVKLVGVDTAGAIVFRSIEPTAPRLEEQARRLLSAVGGHERPVVATGYGRKLVAGAAQVVTEITCHARGVFATLGREGTLIDLGGQDSKVIALGAGGTVQHFAMNDKCAAGTGRFLEVTAARLQVPIEEIGQLALSTEIEVPISSTCTVFAESEIISLLARGQPVASILRGLHRALVSRLASLVRSVRPRPPYLLSGGVAHNAAVRAFLGQALAEEIVLPDEPQLMGALGAALIGAARG